MGCRIILFSMFVKSCPSMSSIHPCFLLLVHFIFHVILVFLGSCHLQMTTVWVIWLTRCSNGSNAHIQGSSCHIIILYHQPLCFPGHWSCTPCHHFVINVLSSMTTMLFNLPLCHWWKQLFHYSLPLTLMTKVQILSHQKELHNSLFHIYFFIYWAPPEIFVGLFIIVMLCV